MSCGVVFITFVGNVRPSIRYFARFSCSFGMASAEIHFEKLSIERCYAV